ncbi:hypothetical protein ACWDTI_10355 [Gordonia sp. NPDC003424]
MGVRLVDDDPAAVTYQQQVSQWQRDSHGRIGIPTLGVLIDAALGSAAYLARKTLTWS